MKVLKQVLIGIRLEKKHFVQSRPAMTTGDYRVIRSACTDRSDQFSLYSKPAIPVFNHRLVDDFKEHEIRISPGQVSGECTPEFRECFDTPLFAIHPQFELVTRMNINDNRQTRAQNHVECIVDVLEIGGVQN